MMVEEEQEISQWYKFSPSPPADFLSLDQYHFYALNQDTIKQRVKRRSTGTHTVLTYAFQSKSWNITETPASLTPSPRLLKKYEL